MIIFTPSKRFLSFIIFVLIGSIAFSQSPVLKIDLNMSGRSEEECNDPNYLPWIPDNATSISYSKNGVTFTFTKIGTGDALRADYYKAGVQTPYFARLVCDGMRVDGGDAGAQIQLTISGLSTGIHSLLSYHNGLSSQQCSPLDVLVNGNTVINNLAMPLRATATADAAVSYVIFNATSGQNTVILFKAETSSSAPIKNVYICGIELNTPNFEFQAKSPSPGDGDQHSFDPGTVNLSWEAASNAVVHRVYFGTSKSAVSEANQSSAEYMGEQNATSFSRGGLSSNQMYFWRVDEVASDGTVTMGNVWKFRPRHLAFPGAEGYGRYAIGGRGGKVVHVTNLNDSEAGSFRDAVENQTGPRTIVFDISGVIALESRLVVNDPYVTIAGQTAPGKGICIRKAPVGFTGNDLIARHMKVRLGAGPTYDGMGMTGANHSILDHCSISWTIDESFSSRGSKNITLQRTLISEALNAAGHQNYPAGTEHGYAATIGGDIGSFHHNLLAHNYGRNWSMGGGLDGNAYYAGRLDIVNNVVYNWGARTTDGGAHETNFIGNYYKPGAGSKIFVAMSIDHENTGLGTQRGYFSGNVMPGYFNESNQSAGRRETYSNGDSKKYEGYVNSPFFPSYISIQSATDAYKDVLSDVGQTQPVLDDHDKRMVDETLNGTYSVTGSVTGKKGFPDHQNDAGGYESYPVVSRSSDWDTDLDGLPDFWEKMIGTNPNSGSGDFTDSNDDPDGDGYTNLEDYLNWMAETHYFVAYNTNQNIDLTAMFKGYSKTSPSYTVNNVINGTVSISGSTATFKPSACGFASFDLTVRDNTGATMTKSIGVFTESATPGQCTLKVYDCAGVEDGEATLDDCGICSGGTTGITACTDALQGEDYCDAIGVQEASNAGFIGNGYLNFENILASNSTWNIYSENGGTAIIGVRYANGGSTARAMSVSVNGSSQTNLNASPTGGWTTWNTENISLNLDAGVNTLVFTATTSDGGPNIDLLALTDPNLKTGYCTTDCNGVFGGTAFTDDCGTCVGGSTGKEACTQDCEGNWGGTAYLDNCGICISASNGYQECSGSMEAEYACSVDGILLESKNEGFSGEGYVNADNVVGASATWILNSNSDQTATLSFRYANGGTASRDGDLIVNGNSSGTLSLPVTGDWTSWQMASIQVNLMEGGNEINLSALTADGLANIDLISYSEGVSDGLCVITGVDDQKNTSLSIYPNPTHGKVELSENSDWQLMNYLGSKLKSSDNSKLIDLTPFPEGIYYLLVEGVMYKIIKN